MRFSITTTVGCPNNCTFCPQDLFVKNYYKISRLRLMPWESFKKCVDKIPEQFGIDFGGFSEPFQNPLCTKMILYTKETNHKIRIYTTLVATTMQDFEILLKKLSLKKDGSDYIYVHLPSVEKMDLIRVTDNYKEILKKLIKSKYPHIIFLQHGSEVKESLKEIIDPKKVRYFPLNTRASLVDRFFRSTSPRKRGAITCSIKLRDRIVMPDGNVAMCCQDFGLKHIVGNLIESDFPAMINNKEIEFVRNAWNDESKDIICRYCNFAANVNAKAEIYNTPFYFGKIPLLIKVLIYNLFPGVYSFYKSKIGTGNKNDFYLKW